MKLNIVCSTNGSGLWSKCSRKVRITDIKSYMVFEPHGQWAGGNGLVEVKFNTEDWNVHNDGLIYTDKRFINELRKGLTLNGFTKAQVRDFDYDEQGSQGEDYVMCYVKKPFMDRLLELEKE